MQLEIDQNASLMRDTSGLFEPAIYGKTMVGKLRDLHFIGSLLLIIFLSASVFADTIRLKDGSIIKGRITGFEGGVFTVVVGEGARKRQLTYDASEVESIEFDSATATVEPIVSKTKIRDQDTKETEYVAASTPPANIPRVIKTDLPAPSAKPTPAPVSSPKKDVPVVTSSGIKPIEVSVKVMADNSSNGWTNSGWIVKKGQKIRIKGDGNISIGNGRTTGPSGLYDLEDEQKLLKSVPTGALIAVVGDDNNEFIYIGSERTFTASRDGALFLGVNEGDLADNSGSFEVTIEIFP